MTTTRVTKKRLRRIATQRKIVHVYLRKRRSLMRSWRRSTKYLEWFRKYTGMAQPGDSPQSLWGNRQRGASRSPIRRKQVPIAPNTSSPCTRHRPINKRTNNLREMKWRRATTLFEDKDRLLIFAAGSFDLLLISRNIENYRLFFTSDSLIIREQLVR